MKDYNAIRTYIEGLFGPTAEGNIVIFERSEAGSSRHVVTPYKDREIAFTRLAHQPQNVHVYVGVALHDENARHERTRRADTASVMTFLALDVDLATGVHAAKNLPADPEQALSLLRESGLPEPTMIVDSGGGLYPIWQFDKSFTICTPDDRTRIERLWKAWNAQAIATWDRHGLKLDPIAELARVLRVPGTINPKTEPPRAVRLFLEDTGRRWTLGQLEEVVAPRLAVQAAPDQTSVDGTLAGALKREWLSEDNEVAAGVYSMMTACAFLRACDEQAGNLTEPQWKDAADIMVHVPEGSRYFHQLSARDPRYSHTETEAKLDHAKRYRPKRCETIASRNPECEGCLFRQVGGVRTPVQLTKTEPGLVQLQNRYVLDTKTGLFFDIRTGREKTKDDFDRSFTRDMHKNRTASTTFRNSRTSCLADEHDYLVGDTRLIIDRQDARILNIWKDGGVVAAAGDPSIWLEHLDYLVPAEAERRWILQYLAHLVQRPATKIKSVIVLQSKQGVGKNLLVQCIKRMFHENDVRELYGGVLGERWQADMGNARLLALDELQIDDLKAAYNRLKRWATEETQLVERKGVDAFLVRTPRGFIIMTNSHKPMAIEHDDRRLFICNIEAAKRGRDYYTRLHDVGLADETVAAFKHFLLGVDLSDFDANAEPPLTAAKSDLIRASASIPEQVILELRESGSWPFSRPVYMADDVARAVEERLRRTTTAQQITPILKKLGDCKRSKKTTIGNLAVGTRRGYLWAWQDVDQWMAASDEDVKRALTGNASASSRFKVINPASVAAVQLAN